MARILMTPEELLWHADSYQWAAGGWSLSNTHHYYSHAGTSPVRTFGGYGGAYSMQLGRGDKSDVITLTSPDLGDVSHGHMACGCRRDGYPLTFIGRTSAGSTFELSLAGSAGATWILKSGSASTLATGTATPAVGAWQNLEVEWAVDPATGACTIKTWVDGLADIAYVGTTTAQTVTHLRWTGQRSNCYWDDLAVNTITLRYDGGTGSTPTIGNTVTDGGTSTTAKIIAVSGDATAGVLTLRSPSGAFGNNNIITDGSGFSASVDAPHADYVDGFEPNSGRMGVQVQAPIVATGAGALTQLTPSTGANWQCVDETWASTGDYVTATVADQTDLYTHNASTVLPANAIVQAVQAQQKAMSSLTGINGSKYVLSDGTTLYTSERLTLTGTYTSTQHIWNERPDIQEAWTRAAIVTTLTQHGNKYVA